MTQSNETPPESGKKPFPRQMLSRLLLLSLLSIFLLGYLAPTVTSPAGTKVSLSKVLSHLDSSGGSKIKKATIDENTQTISITLENGKKLSANFPLTYGKELSTKFVEADVELSSLAPAKGNAFVALFINILPAVLILSFLFWMMRKGGMAGMAGKLGKKNDPVEVPTTRFSDVAGADEAVAELREVVDLLHNPERFDRLGAKPARGFLLVGPPGTGKTLLARAVAGEANVPFFYISGSDFVEVFAGLGASRVRSLFQKARESGKAIIFLDEIDAVGKARGGSGFMSGANDERENTLNQLLVEMDGFTQSGIVLLAATNRPDVLDPALLRPGRFDRKILVSAPDRRGREQILELYAKDKPVATDVVWADFARRTPGLTGADLSGLMNEAALEAARRALDAIDNDCVESALQTTVLGRERRSAQITRRDRRIVAWHEAGHTVAALALEAADDPVTVTIVPRGVAGGVTWMGGNDHDFLTRSQALAQLTVAMAGRAAEEQLLNGDFTQGAHGDLSSATNLATNMIARFGMGSKMVARADRMISGADPVEDEAAVMIGDALVNARALLNKHSVLLSTLADTLLEEETVQLHRLLELAAVTDPELLAEREAYAVAQYGESTPS